MKFEFSASSSKHAETKAREILFKHPAWGTLIGIRHVHGSTYEAEASAPEPELQEPKKSSESKPKKDAKPKSTKTKKR